MESCSWTSVPRMPHRRCGAGRLKLPKLAATAQTESRVKQAACLAQLWGVTLKTAKFLKKTENSRSFLKTVRFPLNKLFTLSVVFISRSFRLEVSTSVTWILILTPFCEEKPLCARACGNMRVNHQSVCHPSLLYTVIRVLVERFTMDVPPKQQF